MVLGIVVMVTVNIVILFNSDGDHRGTSGDSSDRDRGGSSSQHRKYMRCI